MGNLKHVCIYFLSFIKHGYSALRNTLHVTFVFHNVTTNATTATEAMRQVERFEGIKY